MTSKTKKWLFGSFVAAVVVAFGAAVALGVFEKEEEPVKTFNDYVVEDFNYAKSFPDFVAFYEVEAELNAGIDSTALDSLVIVKTKTVFETKDTARYIERNYLTGEVVESCEFGHWGGTFAIDSLTNVKVSFEDALKAVKEQTEFKVPDGKFMTFRFPFPSGDKEARVVYIFGSHFTSYLSVDAETGEVNPFGNEEVTE